MSDESLVCRFIFTSKEYGWAMRSYWRHSKIKWFALLLMVVIVSVGIYNEAYPPVTPGIPVHPITPLSVFLDFLPILFFLGFMFYLSLYAGRFAFRRGAYFNKELVYTLRESGVHVHSPLTETEMKWAIFACATESSYGFALFHQGKRAFNWLPKQGFAGPGEIDLCRELFRKNIKDTKRLLRS